MRSVRVTIVTVQKQDVLHILNVCLLHKVIQHTQRMYRIMLSYVAYSGCAKLLLVIS
jgi:hypothetical protein